ncbi:hypothetical protein SAMN02745146_1814 [Hymenobacter daecheongensis DSM 21074]|uniref:SpoIIAA-like n=1 Tax=Hymenobacter daecheongensis DSM 21074 TaxID=1121955 RepID=A0A1M6EU57_9BACT|nr:hypothetical protein [Hymenobacter daecheongensis]SHI88967.1 hypothetical protein SAMN02745146_1814 [Hymenobacter daecheongensis DSM 21074]
MSIFASSYLDIAYQPHERVLTGRWRRGVMPFELQRGYLALLDEAVARRCRYWLIDLSGRATGLDAADVHWLLEEFFPQVPVRLRRPVYVAYLMASHQLAGMLANPAVPALTYFAGRPYTVERFTTEDEAMAWLAQCRREDARARRRKAV